MTQPTSQPENPFAQAVARTAGSSTKVKIPGNRRKQMRILMAIGGGIVVVGIILALLGFFMYQQAKGVMAKVSATEAAGREAYDALKNQNLVVAGEKLALTRTALEETQKEVQKFSWTKAIPFAGAYYRDSEHGFTAAFAGLSAAQRAIKEIEPYSDVLGLQGQGSFTGGSAEERIAKLVETLDKVTPALDDISKDLTVVNTELAAIDPARYPESFRGIAVRSLLTQAKAGANEASIALTEKRPAIEALPDIAGKDKRKKYLVLFQNSGELRPTGGFLTAYAVINVDKGKVEAESSGDIYDLDVRFRNKPPIPDILKRFLTTESRWNLRDMNLSPDFKQSMTTFNENYQKIQGQKAEFDGIIAVDTHFLESLLQVIGPVEVAGYGTFTADTDPRCDCPQIIYALSEIIDRPTPYIRENRKGILGPMMKAILTKSYSTPKNLWPKLVETGWKDIEGKHIQFFFYDEQLQAAAEAVNAAGRIQPPKQGEDYLAIIDTNLAGAKSNFFVNSNVEHEVDVADGMLTHKIIVNYKNPRRGDNCNLEAGLLCLNGVLQDWVRFYVPAGARLVDSQGFDQGSVKESSELGLTVIEGTFRLQPLSQAKVQMTYQVPYTNTTEYQVRLQKQGGTEDVKHMFFVGGQEHEVVLDKDKTVSFPL